MRNILLSSLLSAWCGVAVADDGIDPLNAVYRHSSVETSDRRIVLAPVDDDVRFSITLTDSETGFERRHEFDGQGASDPSPFLLRERAYCGAQAILLTVEFPWRHALPQPTLILGTYAFGSDDFAFIDMTAGPLTDVALQDDGVDAGLSEDILPPVGVRCAAGATTGPFQFFRRDEK